MRQCKGLGIGRLGDCVVAVTGWSRWVPGAEVAARDRISYLWQAQWDSSQQPNAHNSGSFQDRLVGFLSELQPLALLPLNSGNLTVFSESPIQTKYLSPAGVWRFHKTLFTFLGLFSFPFALGQRTEWILLSDPDGLWSLVSKAYSLLLPLPCSRSFLWSPHSHPTSFSSPWLLKTTLQIFWYVSLNCSVFLQNCFVCTHYF